MIYTIGYQRLSLDRLDAILKALNAQLIDCRNKPVSRIRGYHSGQLERRYGPRYERRGHELGGRDNTTSAGIDNLRTTAKKHNVLLMCMEHAPGDCHRHFSICIPHFPEAIHLFEDDMITAGELEASIDEDREYELCGSVRDLLK